MPTALPLRRGIWECEASANKMLARAVRTAPGVVNKGPSMNSRALIDIGHVESPEFVDPVHVLVERNSIATRVLALTETELSLS